MEQVNNMKFKKLFIKCDKLGRICEILYAGEEGNTTPVELKPTLNHFRGRQFTKSSKNELINYAKLSLMAQQGNEEAVECLTEIHKEWNNGQD